MQKKKPLDLIPILLPIYNHFMLIIGLQAEQEAEKLP
jgi:hypothetical protein